MLLITSIRQALRHYLFLLVFPLLNWISVPGFGQAPDLRCASVDANGNVTLSWLLPADSCGFFNSYVLYYSNNFNGPYTPAGTVTGFFQTGFTHTGANANISVLYYYMINNSGCPSNISDTVSTVFASVANNASGLSLISWNYVLTTTTTGFYKVIREYPKGTFVTLDTLVSGNSFTDTISVCFGDSAWYYVQISDISGCINQSSLALLTNDILQPLQIVIDSVSVDPVTGMAVIGWSAGATIDIAGYIIYLANPLGGWDSIGYLPGINSTFFSYIGSLAVAKTESYSIAAVDKCGNTSAISNGHNTMFLSASLDKCKAQSALSWTAYSGWAMGGVYYGVYAKISGLWTLLGTTAGTSYTHANLVKDSTYCYVVRASDGSGRSSTSNRVCMIADVTRPPAFAYLNMVTVNTNGTVDISCYVDNSADVDYYKIQRSLDTITYEVINIVNGSGTGKQISFTDKTALTSDYIYYYRVVVVDSCGMEALTSNLGRTILLLAEAKSDVSNKLSWNRYRDWLGGVNSYSVYRSIDESWNNNPVQNFPPVNGMETNELYDDVFQFIDARGRFCYYVKAVQQPVTNPYLSGPSILSDSSFSNIACVDQYAKLLVPNTFTPNGDGVNEDFKPNYAFVDVSDYLFLIYNRFGQEIFRTANPDIGWEGKYNGKNIPSGAYVYYFRFKVGQDSRVVEKTGTITLIR